MTTKTISTRALTIGLSLTAACMHAHPGHSAFDPTAAMPHPGHEVEYLTVAGLIVLAAALAVRAFVKRRR